MKFEMTKSNENKKKRYMSFSMGVYWNYVQVAEKTTRRQQLAHTW